jgi:hypothetical protein
MKKTSICYDCKFAREVDGVFTCILLDDTSKPQTDCNHYTPPVGRYDNIETAKDLIREVISGGFSTQQHDRNRAADIFGRTSIGELAALANSTEEICGKYVHSTFYFIAHGIWNWEELVRFYNEHTNTDKAELRKTKATLADTEKERARLQSDYDTALQSCREANNNHRNAADDLAAAQQEIVTLKAKLYDLMTAGA